MAFFAQRPAPRAFHTLLAWYFVAVWGAGFIATKVALQHAAPLTFLTLRFALGTLCLIPIVWLTRAAWPSGTVLAHVVVAGLLMHAIHLSGSHYTQYLGLSAGITSVLLCIQALIAVRWMHEKLSRLQWAGIALGLAGVTLIVWHKIDVREATAGSLIAVTVALFGVTAGTLYQRVFCPSVDLRAAALVQFAATFLVLAPLALTFEDNAIRWSWALAGALLYLVIFASLLAVSAWHYLMRHGGATRVTSLVYLTPAFAIVPEFLWFGITPSTVSWAGIVITCMGVGLVVWRSGNARPKARS
ncbi:MAG TPA: DMT family transporter [Burkholderiales bacterium]|nr:DMT family transporter [Burkholderiales bacterium]